MTILRTLLTLSVLLSSQQAGALDTDGTFASANTAFAVTLTGDEPEPDQPDAGAPPASLPAEHRPLAAVDAVFATRSRPDSRPTTRPPIRAPPA